jgi:hypothetical protein|eukprot:g4890.t1
MRPRRKGEKSADGQLNTEAFKAAGFTGKGYVPTPRSQLVDLSYSQLALRRRKQLSKIEGIKDSIEALNCDPEMLVEAYEAKKHLQPSDLDLPPPPMDVPTLHETVETIEVKRKHSKTADDGSVTVRTWTETATRYNVYARERLRAIFDRFDAHSIARWGLPEFSTFCRAAGRGVEFQHELYSQKTWAAMIMKRYASDQLIAGLDFEGLVRLHWDCQGTRTLHQDLDVLKLPIENSRERETERVERAVNLFAKTLQVDIVLPEKNRIKLERQAKLAKRIAERDGKKAPRSIIPKFLELDFDVLVPEHIAPIVFDLYQVPITDDHAKEIIVDVGWTDDVPYVKPSDFVAYVLERTEVVQDEQKAGAQKVVPFIKERVARTTVAYFTLKVSVAIKTKFLRVRAALSSVGRVAARRKALFPPPVKKRSKPKLAALTQFSKPKERETLKSGIQVNLAVCIGELEKRMFSNTQGLDNMVAVQAEWCNLESHELTELLDGIDAPDKIETFISLDFQVYDYIPTDNLDVLEMGLRGAMNVYAKPIFESLPQYHSFTIELVQEEQRVFRLNIFFQGKAIRIREKLGLHTAVSNLLRKFSYRVDMCPGEKNLFSVNRAKMAILSDLFRCRGAGSINFPRKHILEFLRCFLEASKEDPGSTGSGLLCNFARFFIEYVEWTDSADVEFTCVSLSQFFSENAWMHGMFGKVKMLYFASKLESPGGLVDLIELFWKKQFSYNFEQTQGFVRRAMNRYKKNEYTDTDYKLVSMYKVFVEAIKGVAKLQFQCSERGFKFIFTNMSTGLLAKLALHNPGGK